ncbi:MAG: peptidase M41 [Flavobacteriales bacterium]|nr:peptidase M41 [Flavobacteriales bacterium]|tara:strand:- start:720 stop:2666 length:1947 start_codon:yes stop_codon:yes gene_type:complete
MKKQKLPKGFKVIKFNIYWIYGAIFLFFLLVQFFGSDSTKQTNWQEFNSRMLQPKKVEKVVIINKEKAFIHIKRENLNEDFFQNVNKKSFSETPNYGPHYYFEIGSVETFNDNLKEAQKDFEEYEKISPYYETKENILGDILSWILPLIIFIGIWFFIMKRMSGAGGAGSQIFNIGKTQGKLIDKDKMKVTFKDVAGLEEAKEEITEIVDFLKSPEKYTKLGGKIPRGAMLIGPPGTGKTLLAKAVAGEAKVPFFSLSGSDFVEMFVGVGASRVRDLFKQAKEKSPSIIFIDEIDAIGRARGKNAMTGSNDERENTLNQLLTEMDGFTTNSGVIVMAATNRADILDKALTRAGRFDRQIFVDLPNLVERKQIFQVHLKPLKISSSIDINFLARQTPGFSGADIANVCNESALIAARKSKKQINKQDFLDAVDRIIGGLEKKSKIISPNEKKTIAFHEAGHATVSWMLEFASPLIKVTIVPRGKSLGAAWYLPEERQLTTTEQMLDEICAALGGRAAEELFFKKISTGALSDLEKVTKQAYAMVSIYGLSEKVGNLSYYDSSGQQSGFTKPYSETRAQIIDTEVSKIIENQYKRAKNIIMKNKKKLEKLADQLLKNEVIFKNDLVDIFGERKWLSYEEEQLKKTDKKNN